MRTVVFLEAEQVLLLGAVHHADIAAPFGLRVLRHLDITDIGGDHHGGYNEKKRVRALA